MKVIRSLIIGALIFAALFIGIAFASGASLDSIIDSFNENDTYILQDPIVYEENMDTLNIEVEDRSITIEPTTASTITIEHYRKDDETWDIDLSDGVLSITQTKDRDFFDWFNWGITMQDKKQIVVMIPETYMFDVDMSTHTGDITFADFDELKDVSIKTTTGDILLENYSSSKLNIESNTGDVTLDQITVTNQLEVEVTTGDIRVKEVDANAMTLSATTGNIHVDHATTHAISTNTNTGDIQIEDVMADTFDLSASTGQIKVIDVDLENRSLYLDTNTGDIIVDGYRQGNQYTYVNDENYYIDASTSTGDIKINP